MRSLLPKWRKSVISLTPASAAIRAVVVRSYPSRSNRSSADSTRRARVLSDRAEAPTVLPLTREMLVTNIRPRQCAVARGRCPSLDSIVRDASDLACRREPRAATVAPSPGHHVHLEDPMTSADTPAADAVEGRDAIEQGRASLGIELGSTRIKACLIGDDA